MKPPTESTNPATLANAEAVSVTGVVEGLAGGYLSGWAVDPDRPGPCEIVVLDEQETVLAEGLADRPRSDLGAYGFGRDDFAFRLAIPRLSDSACLRIYADGAELSGSPVMTGEGLFDGAVSVNEGWIDGWVHERILPPNAPDITVMDQSGRCIAEGHTRSGGEDSLFAPARFHLKLDRSAWDGSELGITAQADGVMFASAYTRLDLLGHLDDLSERACSGWVVCPQARTTRLDVELWLDGTLQSSMTARTARTDLRDSFLDPWDVGFAFALPPALERNRPRMISLRLSGSRRELFGGPFMVGGLQAHVSSARSLSRRLRLFNGLSNAERAILDTALQNYISQSRLGLADRMPARIAKPGPQAVRLSIAIPVYRDVGVTRSCIDSVLAHRGTQDVLVVVNDCSPEEGMADLLDFYKSQQRVHVLTNVRNEGFVRSANRALEFCREGDVLLLNSDTRIFAGGIDALWAAARRDPSIGTVTPLSNHATIFSYPVCNAGCAALADVGWDTLAAVALDVNAEMVLDVPTGHGFCMLITREMLDQIGLFDEAFGRGYGEENDLCQRAADRGFRHVAAVGVLVEHRESVSFNEEKQALLTNNLAKLEQRYPEYAADIRDFIASDNLRAARWPLDRFRLQRSSGPFVLMLRNWLGGGTQKAIDDSLAFTTLERARLLDLAVDIDGTMRLSCVAPRLTAVFARGEHDAIWNMLGGLPIDAVVIHQLLGFDASFVDALRMAWGGMRRFYYLHDFYPLCPRVTLVDATDNFCNVAPVDVCMRCVEIAGTHEASRMDSLDPRQHRTLFAALLQDMDAIVIPSANAASYLARDWPSLAVTVQPHAEPVGAFDIERPKVIGPDIVLLGAIGPHKGSGLLLQIARRARLVCPTLRFHVLGYTDCDTDLRETGVVSISGPYKSESLPELVAATGASLALFLHRWPETFSYTLSEAVQLGLIPLVPNIGAPADRVRDAGYGLVFGFPINPAEVLALLDDIVSGRIDPAPGDASPRSFASPVQTIPPWLMMTTQA